MVLKLVLAALLLPALALAKGNRPALSVVESGDGRTVAGIRFPAGARVELLAEQPVGALLRQGGRLCGVTFERGSQVTFRRGAPSLLVEADASSTRLADAPATIDAPTPGWVVRGLPAHGATVGGLSFEDGAPLFTACRDDGILQVRSGRLAHDRVLEGTFYPAGTTVVFRQDGRLAEVGIYEPLLIRGWRFPAWSIVRFDGEGHLASAETTRGGDALLEPSCPGETPVVWGDELPAQLACGPSCFRQVSAERSVRIYGADCAAPTTIDAARVCGVDTAPGDDLEIRGTLVYWRPSTDVVVEGLPLLHGRRVAVECTGGGARLRLGTLAAASPVQRTTFPALSEVRIYEDRAAVRLPIPVTVAFARYPAGVLLELRAGRPRRASMTEVRIDEVTISGRRCRLGPEDAVEIGETGAVTSCTPVR